jgi:chemotaxis signal transduction protein
MPENVNELYGIRRIDDLQSQLTDLRRQLSPSSCCWNLPETSFYILACRVGDEHAAFLQSSVDEVVMVAKLNQVPQSSFWFPGLLDRNGKQIPVIDAQARISGRPRQVNLSDLIVICREQVRQVGFIVQEVYGSYPCKASLIERPCRDHPSAPFLLGTFQLDERPMMLFNTAILSATSSHPGAEA